MKTADVTAISPEATDDRLVTAARSGSTEAFAALFQRYRPEIARYAGRTLGDDGRAEDVVQEIFISALRGLATLDRPAGFKPWLYRIAHNACVDHMRRRGKAEEVPFDAQGLPPGEEIRLFRQSPSSHAALTQKENFGHLRQALTDLPEAQAQILILRELEGLSYDEIALRMSISRSAVESMLFRARRSLRAEFGEISTGERCVRMRTVMAQTVEGVGRGRDRRMLVRHLHGCAGCRRDAFVMGLGPLLDVERRSGLRAGLSRVAALLPLPGFLNRRPEETGRISTETGQLSSSAGTAGTSLASHAQAAITHVTVTAGASVEHAATAIQKAAAVVAAAAVVSGGGFVANGTRTERPVPPPTAAKRVDGAQSPGSVPARPGAVFTSPMPLSLAPLATMPVAVPLAAATSPSTDPGAASAPAGPPAEEPAPPADPPTVESASPAEPETFDSSAATAPEPEPAVESVVEPTVIDVPAEESPPTDVEPHPPVIDPPVVIVPGPPDSGGSNPPGADPGDGNGGSGTIDPPAGS
jgi:RNA polymerase sigma factor (sigma-70 family)